MIHHLTNAIDNANGDNYAPADAFYHKTLLIARSKWKSTDGWRGYTEIIPEPGFKVVEDTWATGNWEDAPEGHSDNDMERRAIELEKKYGDVWVIYTPTSNVFSTGVDMLVRDPDTPINRGKPAGKATRRFDEPDGSWRLRYHATDVVRYDAGRKVYTLDTGGYNTMTTGRRMDSVLPGGWYTYRRNWVMYLHRPGEDDVEIKDGMEVPA